MMAYLIAKTMMMTATESQTIKKIPMVMAFQIQSIRTTMATEFPMRRKLIPMGMGYLII
jgi:hypothetical protein